MVRQPKSLGSVPSVPSYTGVTKGVEGARTTNKWFGQRAQLHRALKAREPQTNGTLHASVLEERYWHAVGRRAWGRSNRHAHGTGYAHTLTMNIPRIEHGTRRHGADLRAVCLYTRQSLPFHGCLSTLRRCECVDVCVTTSVVWQLSCLCGAGVDFMSG